MARSIKNNPPRIFVVTMNSTNTGSFIVHSFGDTLESVNGSDFNISESAEQKSSAFLSTHSNSKIMDGAKTTEEAIEMANKGRS